MNFESDENEDLSSNDSIINIVKAIILPSIDFKSICPRITINEIQPIPKSNWWSECWPRLLQRSFKRIYRMSRETILALVQFLLPFTIYTEEKLLKAVCVCVNYLATHERMYDLMFKYDMALGAISESITFVTELLVVYLVPEVVQWPSTDEREIIQQEILNKYKIPIAAFHMETLSWGSS